MQNLVEGVSQGHIERTNYLQFDNDQYFVQLSLAGYVVERGIGIWHDIASVHASQDFNDILNWQGFDHIYEYGYNPTGFKENGDIACEEITPPLEQKQVKEKLLSLFYTQLPIIGKILSENRDKLYTLGISLHDKKLLSYDEVQKTLKD